MSIWVPLLAVALLAVHAEGTAAASARVNGAEVGGKEARLYATDILKVEQGKLTPQDDDVALRKVVTNRALYARALAEKPEIVASSTREVEIAFLRRYFDDYYTKVAFPRAKQEVTVDTVAPTLAEQEDVVSIRQIVLRPDDCAELPALVDRIKAGEISFEDAARQHSVGLTAAQGGQVGGVRRKSGTDRYTEEQLALFFSTPPGSLTPIFSLPFGCSVARVEKLVPEAEVRRAMAEQVLPERVKARAVAICWEDALDRAAAKGDAVLVTAEMSEEQLTNPATPAFRIGDKTYLIRDLLVTSGGLSHGTKDIRTIAENRFRDLQLQALYQEKVGFPPEHDLLFRLTLEHYVAREYLAFASRDLGVTDEEVDAYIAEHPEKYRLLDRLDLGVIYAKTETRLKEVQQRLAEGVPFETVAKAWSQDPKSAQNEGRIGVVPAASVANDKGDFQPGIVSDPIKVEDGAGAGYYLLKVYRHLPAEPGTRANLGEGVVGGIRSILVTKKKENRLASVVKEAYQAAKVEFLP